MDYIQKLHLEREKKFYNIMSLEIYDILDPKREVKIKHEDMKYKKWLLNYDPEKVDTEMKRLRTLSRKKMRSQNRLTSLADTENNEQSLIN